MMCIFWGLWFLFFMHSVESVCEPPRWRFTLAYLQYISWTNPKIKSYSLISWMKWLKEFINNFLYILIRCKFILSLLGYITHSSSTSFQEMKLIAIFNWIFHVSEFLRSFIIFLKKGLILVPYSSSNKLLFLWPLLSYSI